MLNCVPDSRSSSPLPGHDSVHSSELPDGNRTSDTRMSELSDAEGRVVVTKDRDFCHSHLLRGTPVACCALGVR